jgi:hypothetical protein
MPGIDLNALQNCDFEPHLHENIIFLTQLAFFRDIVIDDSHEMHTAIAALEILKIKLDGWLIRHKSHFTGADINYLSDMLERNLTQLRRHEGVDFINTAGSFRMCLRIIQFILAAFYDVPDNIFGFCSVPREIMELV